MRAKYWAYFFFCMQNLRNRTLLKRMCPVCTIPVCSSLLRKRGHIVQTLRLELVRELSCLSDKVKDSLWRWNKTLPPSAPFRWARWTRRFTLSESDAAWMALKSHSDSRKLWNLDRCDSVKLFFFKSWFTVKTKLEKKQNHPHCEWKSGKLQQQFTGHNNNRFSNPICLGSTLIAFIEGI